MASIISIDYGAIRHSLSIEVIVSNINSGVQKRYTALWDTGANRSVITKKVFNELLLQCIKRVKVIGVNSARVVSLTGVNIELPNELVFKDCEVAVCDIGGGVDVLLGMDIITAGDFLITNNDTTVLSYNKGAIKGLRTLDDFLRRAA